MTTRPNILRLLVPDDQRITSLHVWVAIHDNGGEGIMSVDIEVPGLGTRHLPMVVSRLDLARRIEPMVRKAAAATQATEQPVRRLELRSFTMDTAPEGQTP